MYPRAVCLAVVALLLSGCGSDVSSKADGGDRADLRSATTAYFTSEDTEALDKAAAATQEVSAGAGNVMSVRTCEELVDDPAWQSCWHGLLDPYLTELTGLAGAFTALTTRELRTPCLTALENGAERITTFAGTIDALLVGIDSPDRAVRVKSARTYTRRLDNLTRGFARPLANLTQHCHSPDDP